MVWRLFSSEPLLFSKIAELAVETVTGIVGQTVRFCVAGGARALLSRFLDLLSFLPGDVVLQGPIVVAAV